MAKGRTPVWKQVEEQEAQKLSSRARRARAAQKQGRRLAVVYDIEPPHVRLGIAWFLLVVVAMAVAGTFGLALVYATCSALAAYQCARAWRRRKPNRPDPQVAAVIGGLLPLAAAVSTGMIGVALLLAVVLAVLRAYPETRTPVLATAGRTLQCSLWVGGAAAGVVAAHRYESWAAIGLVLVVSAYETGDYLVGSGARNVVEGPVAGIAAVLVVQFAVAAAGFPPFEIGNSLGFALLAAVLAPAGQVVASLVLPAAGAPAPAVRRLDSLILLAPVWALVAGAIAAGQT
jgi:hypothetical protein